MVDIPSSNAHASDWSQWNARAYLEEYFQALGSEAEITTQFVSRELAHFKGKLISRALEFGAGPTIIGVLGLTPYVQEIHLADYLEKNLEEIELWLKDDPGAFNWDVVIAYTLTLEGITPTATNIKKRAVELRERVTKVMKGDASLMHPISLSLTYPLIISLYCADSATDSKDTWQRYMTNILNLLAPSGTILVAALRNCTFYTVGNHTFPSANINEDDLTDMFLSNNFSEQDVNIKVIDIPERDSEGFTSIMLARARKSSKITS